MRYAIYNLRRSLRFSMLGQFLLRLAHKPDHISTWRHDLIERMIYGRNG